MKRFPPNRAEEDVRTAPWLEMHVIISMGLFSQAFLVLAHFLFKNAGLRTTL